MTPEKNTVEILVTGEINRLLQEKNLTKNRFAQELGMSYTKLKRSLNGLQQMKLVEADNLLKALGSSLAEVLVGESVKEFHDKLMQELKNFKL